MSTRIRTSSARGMCTAQSTIWFGILPTYGRYSSKIWTEMIELLRSCGTNVEIVVKPRGLCIRTTFTRLFTSPPSKEDWTSSPAFLGKGNRIGTLLIPPVHSSSQMIGLVPLNSSKTGTCSIPDTVLETAISLSVQESRCFVTLSQTTEDISVRIEYYPLG